jgi:hypothetical protein
LVEFFGMLKQYKHFDLDDVRNKRIRIEKFKKNYTESKIENSHCVSLHTRAY